MTEPLPWDALASRVPHTDPIELQRQAGLWAAGLVNEFAAGGASLLSFGPLKFDALEALRAQFVMRGGTALAHAETLTRLGDQLPPNARLAGKDALEAARVARALGQAGVEASGVPMKERWPGAAGWQAKHVLGSARRSRAAAAPREPSFCVMLPRMPGHLADLVPVARELTRSGHRTVLATDALEHEVVSAGLLWASSSNVRSRHFASALAQLARLAQRALAAETRLGELPLPLTQHLAFRVVTENLAPLAELASGVIRLLNDYQPRVLVVGNPYTMEGRAAALLAQSAGVRTSSIEHGSIFAHDPYWERCLVDQVLVWGEPSARALISSGVRPGSVRVVGAPRLDAFVHARGTRPPAVLVASSGGGDQVSHTEHAKFVDTVYSAASSTQDISWVVKLHPKDDPGIYAAAAARHPRAQVSVVRGERARAGTEIFEFLARAGVLVTVVSTTALDAMAVGVPVIAVTADVPARRARIEFLARETATRVETATELAAAVRAKIESGPDSTDQRAAAYASEHYANRGQAAERAAQALLALTEPSGSP